MHRIVFPVLIALTSLFVASCSSPLATDPAIDVLPSGTGAIQLQISVNESATHAAPSLQRAASTDFASGVATLSGPGLSTVSSPLTISNGRYTATLRAKAGLYTLTINFFNAAGYLTFTGSSAIAVRPGITVSAPVTVNPNLASITVDEVLPPEAVVPASPYSGEYTTLVQDQDGLIIGYRGEVTTISEGANANQLLMVRTGDSTVRELVVNGDGTVYFPNWNLTGHLNTQTIVIDPSVYALSPKIRTSYEPGTMIILNNDTVFALVSK